MWHLPDKRSRSFLENWFASVVNRFYHPNKSIRCLRFAADLAIPSFAIYSRGKNKLALTIIHAEIFNAFNPYRNWF